MIYLDDMVSFLMSEGHVDARHYPIWMLWENVEVARRRINTMLRTQATSMMAAAGAAQAGKKGLKAFKEYLESFDGEG